MCLVTAAKIRPTRICQQSISFSVFFRLKILFFGRKKDDENVFNNFVRVTLHFVRWLELTVFIAYMPFSNQQHTHTHTRTRAREWSIHKQRSSNTTNNKYNHNTKSAAICVIVGTRIAHTKQSTNVFFSLLSGEYVNVRNGRTKNCSRRSISF